MEITIPIPGSARARLIEAAISQFERRGYEGASVVDIAEAAGVTTGSLYHHFRSKSGLYEVIRREMHRRMTERLEGVSAAAPGGPAALLAGFRVTVEASARFGVSRLLAEATLTRPTSNFSQTGGRSGRHSEHLGFILADMQFLQRAYPGATW